MAVEIIYSIPNEKIDEFLLGFLAMNPVPTDTEEQPLYTTKEWVKMCGRDYFLRIYRNGKKRLAEQAAILDSDIFE